MTITHYNINELLIITAAREIKNGEKVFMGTFWPIPAVLLAKKTHAPDITIFVEGGVITEAAPPRVPLVAGDATLSSTAIFAGDTLDTLGAALHGGWIDVAVLSTNNIDRYGNLNTTCIGPYEHPRVRMPGSGGACDLGSLAKKTIIILKQEKRRFQTKLDYITTPGYLQGNNSRFEAGLNQKTGPKKVITDLAVFGFDPTTKEMIVEKIQPGITVEEVQAKVQWPLKLANEVQKMIPPEETELRILREKVDPYGMYIKDKRFH